MAKIWDEEATKLFIAADVYCDRTAALVEVCRRRWQETASDEARQKWGEAINENIAAQKSKWRLHREYLTPMNEETRKVMDDALGP